MPTSLHSELRLPCGATIKNRIAKAAMTEGLADVEDNATQGHINLYRTWAKGGSGLLITGNVMVDRRYLERPGNVVIEDKRGFTQLQNCAIAGTEDNTHLWMQISHPGRQCSRIVSNQPLSPSDVQLHLMGNFAKPRSITETEINQAIAGYVNTALIAKEAGFTGVQVHAAHGYLISQFLSPITNKRQDQWGGSLDNRARFLLNIIRAVRDAVGNDFPVAVKLNSADFQKGGVDLNDSEQVATWLAQEGIDLLEISGGTYEQVRLLGHSGDKEQAEDPNVRTSTRQREAYFLDYAKTIQQALDSAGKKIPLMVTGGFRSRLTMVEALAEGELDMIGLARPLCADADIPRFLISGEISYAPAYEEDLKLGDGWLGPASKNAFLRAINVQGEVAWFYQQMLQLAQLKSACKDQGVLNSLARHFLREYVIAIRRKIYHRRHN